MGTFNVGALVENHTDRKKSFRISKLLVDTGSEHTRLPESFLDKIGVKRDFCVQALSAGPPRCCSSCSRSSGEPMKISVSPLFIT